MAPNLCLFQTTIANLYQNRKMSLPFFERSRFWRRTSTENRNVVRALRVPHFSSPMGSITTANRNTCINDKNRPYRRVESGYSRTGRKYYGGAPLSASLVSSPYVRIKHAPYSFLVRPSPPFLDGNGMRRRSAERREPMESRREKWRKEDALLHPFSVRWLSKWKYVSPSSYTGASFSSASTCATFPEKMVANSIETKTNIGAKQNTETAKEERTRCKRDETLAFPRRRPKVKHSTLLLLSFQDRKIPEKTRECLKCVSRKKRQRLRTRHQKNKKKLIQGGEAKGTPSSSSSPMQSFSATLAIRQIISRIIQFHLAVLQLECCPSPFSFSCLQRDSSASQSMNTSPLTMTSSLSSAPSPTFTSTPPISSPYAFSLTDVHSNPAYPTFPLKFTVPALCLSFSFFVAALIHLTGNSPQRQEWPLLAPLTTALHRGLRSSPPGPSPLASYASSEVTSTFTIREVYETMTRLSFNPLDDQGVKHRKISFVSSYSSSCPITATSTCSSETAPDIPRPLFFSRVLCCRLLLFSCPTLLHITPASYAALHELIEMEQWILDVEGKEEEEEEVKEATQAAGCLLHVRASRPNDKGAPLFFPLKWVTALLERITVSLQPWAREEGFLELLLHDLYQVGREDKKEYSDTGRSTYPTWTNRNRRLAFPVEFTPLPVLASQLRRSGDWSSFEILTSSWLNHHQFQPDSFVCSSLPLTTPFSSDGPDVNMQKRRVEMEGRTMNKDSSVVQKEREKQTETTVGEVERRGSRKEQGRRTPVSYLPPPTITRTSTTLTTSFVTPSLQKCSPSSSSFLEWNEKDGVEYVRAVQYPPAICHTFPTRTLPFPFSCNATCPRILHMRRATPMRTSCGVSTAIACSFLASSTLPWYTDSSALSFTCSDDSNALLGVPPLLSVWNPPDFLISLMHILLGFVAWLIPTFYIPVSAITDLYYQRTMEAYTKDCQVTSCSPENNSEPFFCTPSFSSSFPSSPSLCRGHMKTLLHALKVEAPSWETLRRNLAIYSSVEYMEMTQCWCGDHVGLHTAVQPAVSVPSLSRLLPERPFPVASSLCLPSTLLYVRLYPLFLHKNRGKANHHFSSGFAPTLRRATPCALRGETSSSGRKRTDGVAALRGFLSRGGEKVKPCWNAEEEGGRGVEEGSTIMSHPKSEEPWRKKEKGKSDLDTEQHERHDRNHEEEKISQPERKREEKKTEKKMEERPLVRGWDATTTQWAKASQREENVNPQTPLSKKDAPCHYHPTALPSDQHTPSFATLPSSPASRDEEVIVGPDLSSFSVPKSVKNDPTSSFFPFPFSTSMPPREKDVFSHCRPASPVPPPHHSRKEKAGNRKGGEGTPILRREDPQTGDAHTNTAGRAIMEEEREGETEYSDMLWKELWKDVALLHRDIPQGRVSNDSSVSPTRTSTSSPSPPPQPWQSLDKTSTPMTCIAPRTQVKHHNTDRWTSPTACTTSRRRNSHKREFTSSTHVSHGGTKKHHCLPFPHQECFTSTTHVSSLKEQKKTKKQKEEDDSTYLALLVGDEGGRKAQQERKEKSVPEKDLNLECD